MNTRKMVCMTAVVLMVGGAVGAQDGRPYIGIRLDPTPLPELLTKHLGLRSGQGIRIRNINVASPADAIGLERDDLIIGFQGQEVTDLDRFIAAVQAAGVGTEVRLEIVHLGQPKTVECALASLEGDPKWKYPSEPEVVTSWRPGRFWRAGPDEREWMEIPFDQIPDIDVEVKRFFNQRHTYHHSTEGEEYTISIEGDPGDESSRITVHAGDAEHSSTIGQVDQLPEEYREPAREAIEAATKSSGGRLRIDRERFALPRPPKPDVYRRYFENMTIPRPRGGQWSQKKDQVLEKLEGQMERLQQRIEALEQRHQETLDKLLDKQKEGTGEEDAARDEAEPASEIKPAV